MEQHIRIIFILDIVFGILTILVGLIFLLAFGLGSVGIGAAREPGAGAAAAIMASVGIVLAIFLFIMGGLQILVGLKLKEYKPWARIVQIILAILALPSIPIGTAFGAYCLWVLFNQEGQALFQEKGGGQTQPSSS